MGHAFISLRGRSIHLHDTWIELLRGLIARHARPTPPMRAAFDTFMDEWICVGPGVWMGDAFDSFVTGKDAEARQSMLVAALDAARAAVAAEGDELSTAFLDGIPQHEVYGSGGFGQAVARVTVLDALDRARALLCPS